jgi:hypothetical protein
VPHTFDTGLDKPQRELVRDAVLERLEPLKELYLRTLKGIAGTFDRTDVDWFRKTIQGQTPAVLVALGRKAFAPVGITGRHDGYLATLELHVYVLTDHMRAELARVAGDEPSRTDLTKDPGIETILEHVEELLDGFDGYEDESNTVHPLIPADEDEVWHGDDFTIWRLRFTAKVERTLKRNKGVTQLIELIRTSHNVDGADGQNPVVVTDTEPPP